LIKLFEPPQPIGDVIFRAVRQLRFQHAKLEQATVRLRQRDKVLFDACIAEVKMKRRDRAAICANELSEVRKLLSMVTQCQIALERIILRLETIKEVTEIMADLKPTLKSLNVITRNLVNVMPDVAQELEKINGSISETLAITSFSSPESIAPLSVKTEASEEILKEVSAVLEEKLAERLPAPPSSLIQEKAEARENVKKQMIALSATCSEVTQSAEQGEPESYVTYKDVELQRVSFTVQRQSSLEDAILDYAKSKGEIDVNQCAVELNVPENDVEKALESLGKKQKIMIQR